MLLHHICTISLITFSFLTNYSNVGCVVLFLHDVGDIFVYITRIVINTDASKPIKISTAILLQIVFIYTRLYVFGDLILSIYYGITWGFKWPDTSLTLFLCFLYIMHVNWVYLILKKIFTGLIGGQVEDPAHVKKYSKKN
jgi:ceramide synthetase